MESIIKVDKVINLTTPDEEIIERIVNRRVCSNQDCKAVYNIVLNPPKFMAPIMRMIFKIKKVNN